MSTKRTYGRASLAWAAWLTVIVLGSPAAAAAQNSASANVTATVQQPIVVTKNNDLAFGTVYPGLDKTVAPADAAAAGFAVEGQASANINLTFTLPATISSGSNTLPIASWTGLHNTTNSASGGTSFTPSSSATSTTLHTTGFRYVFIGATAQPGASQPAGSYTGTLTMTVVYF